MRSRATRARWPPERVAGSLPSKPASPDLGERRVHTPAPLGARKARRQGKGQVSADRHMGKEQIVLEQDTDAPPLGRQRGEIDPVQKHPPLGGEGWIQRAADEGEQAGFPSCPRAPSESRPRRDAPGDRAARAAFGRASLIATAAKLRPARSEALITACPAPSAARGGGGRRGAAKAARARSPPAAVPPARSHRLRQPAVGAGGQATASVVKVANRPAPAKRVGR